MFKYDREPSVDMDWEAPADAWYVWIAVGIISFALVGLVLAMPSGPPPDADEGANTIEGVTASSYEASASWEHDADEIKIDGNTISLRNEHGTSHSSVAYGVVVPAWGDERLENIAHGKSFEDEFEDEIDEWDTDASAEFFQKVQEAHDAEAGEWKWAEDELVVRTIAVEPEEIDQVTAEVSEVALDLEFATVDLPTELKLEQVDGETDSIYDWTVSAETHAYDELDEFEDIDDDDGLVDHIADFACNQLPSWLCDGDDEVEEVTTIVAAESDSSVYLREATIDLTDSSYYPEEADYFTGYYPLHVEVEQTFGDLECSGVIDEPGETVELCDSPVSGDEFESEPWLNVDQDQEVYYVTLVTT